MAPRLPASELGSEPLECPARGPEPQLKEQNQGSGWAHVSPSSWQPQKWALGCTVRGGAGPGGFREPDPRPKALAYQRALFSDQLCATTGTTELLCSAALACNQPQALSLIGALLSPSTRPEQPGRWG